MGVFEAFITQAEWDIVEDLAALTGESEEETVSEMLAERLQHAITTMLNEHGELDRSFFSTPTNLAKGLVGPYAHPWLGTDGIEGGAMPFPWSEDED